MRVKRPTDHDEQQDKRGHAADGGHGIEHGDDQLAMAFRDRQAHGRADLNDPCGRRLEAILGEAEHIQARDMREAVKFSRE